MKTIIHSTEDRMFLFVIIAFLCMWLLSGCASTTLYDGAGRRLVTFQGNAASATYSGHGVRFAAVMINHSVPTAAAWRGAARLVSSATPLVAGVAGSGTTSVVAPAAAAAAHLLMPTNP